MWKPEDGEEYYSIGIIDGLFVKYDVEEGWDANSVDNRRLKSNLVFQTEQLRDGAFEKNKRATKNR